MSYMVGIKSKSANVDDHSILCNATNLTNLHILQGIYVFICHTSHIYPVK